MQDDMYVLVQDGWAAGKVLRQLVVKKGDKKSETPDLIAPKLIIERYFAPQQAQIDQLQLEVEAKSQGLEALIEEHVGEEGLLNEAQTDTRKVTKATVTARLKKLKGDKEVKKYLKLFDGETEAKKY